MEADWEVEIGPGAPMVDGCWAGFLDLRLTPALAHTLPEVVDLPALADALARLNRNPSPVWTSKCDVWVLPDSDPVDPYELDADPSQAHHAIACYIDLLPRIPGQWTEPETAISWCTDICKRLKATSSRNCRADLVIRRAAITETSASIGITAYLTACGPTPEVAKGTLQNALANFGDTVCGTSTVK